MIDVWDYVALAAGKLDDALSLLAPPSVGAIAFDGKYVYIHTGVCLAKIGTGFMGSIRGRVVLIHIFSFSFTSPTLPLARSVWLIISLFVCLSITYKNHHNFSAYLAGDANDAA